MFVHEYILDSFRLHRELNLNEVEIDQQIWQIFQIKIIIYQSMVQKQLQKDLFQSYAIQTRLVVAPMNNIPIHTV